MSRALELLKWHCYKGIFNEASWCMFHLMKHLMEKQLLEEDREHRWLECEFENFDINNLFYDFDKDIAVGDHHLLVL